MDTSKIWDVVIIGGGPAGMTAAIYTRRSLLETLIVEQLMPGGNVAITNKVENYPGFNDISGSELSKRMEDQAKNLGVEFLSGQVESISQDEHLKYVTLSDGSYIQTKSIILSTGAGWRNLGVSGERKFTGRGVSYCGTCDGPFFKDKVIAVVGGGDTALDESLYLERFATKIFLIHRRDKFRGAKIYQDRVLKNPKIEVIWDTVVTEIQGDQLVNNLRLKNKKTGEEKDLPVEGVFIFIGQEPNTKFLKTFCDLDDYGYIITDQEMHTRVDGIFAAGDVRKKNLYQIATAVGDGAIAGYMAIKYLEELKCKEEETNECNADQNS